jgi:hypothetical protein
MYLRREADDNFALFGTFELEANSLGWLGFLTLRTLNSADGVGRG